MPWLNVTFDLVDAEEAVGPVAVGLQAEAAQPVARERIAELKLNRRWS